MGWGGRKGRGEYEITYQPVTEGRNQLHIKVEGITIQVSPFNVMVVSPVDCFRAPIQTFKGIKSPWGVAFNHVEEMVITTADCVSVLDPNGTKLRSFGTRGSGHGKLLAPRGVTVDDHGNILVADSGNHRIQKFAGRGKFLASVGTKGTGSLQFNSPRDLAFNVCTKKIYVVDSENNRIQVLNSDLTISSLIGGKQCCRSVEFCYPWGITCDSSGNVYVADSAEHHIQVFAASGEFLRKFGGCGVHEWQPRWPVGVAIGASGEVFVSELNNHRVSVFTTEGRFVTSFGRRGKGVGEFDSPGWLAVNGKGVLYACDTKNDRVQTFQSKI